MIGMRHWRVLYRCPVQRALILIRNEARGSAKWAEHGSNRDSSWWIILLPVLPYFMELLSLFFMIRQEFERILYFFAIFYHILLIWSECAHKTNFPGHPPPRWRPVTPLLGTHSRVFAQYISRRRSRSGGDNSPNEHEMNMKWTWNEHVHIMFAFHLVTSHPFLASVTALPGPMLQTAKGALDGEMKTWCWKPSWDFMGLQTVAIDSASSFQQDNTVILHNLHHIT
jgi:hypothetical protein